MFWKDVGGLNIQTKMKKEAKMPTKHVEGSQLIEGLLAGMAIVKKYQEVPMYIRITLKPADGTLVTLVDKESGEEMYSILRTSFRDGFTFSLEDTETSRSDARYVVLGDPLDGTGAYVNGLSTSTVIIGVYDRGEKRLVACAIGEPATGRIWYTEDGNTFRFPKSVCRVWTPTDDTKGKPTVLLDVSHGFVRSGRQMLTDEQMGKLFQLLNPHVKLLLPGSNGLNHALVANGGELMAGAITTAIGGPWDICGVLLVLNAGGYAKAFRIGDNRTPVEVDPLDVLAADLLISGNTQETVDFLAQQLTACFA